jgi:3-hydroxybenzoate 6-monooxygenase
MNAASNNLPVLVAGGGIGGVAAALALVRRGFEVKVLEQALQLGEIGAGLQIGPNGFAAFDALGIGLFAQVRAVYTNEMVMPAALDVYEMARIPTGEAFFTRNMFNALRDQIDPTIAAISTIMIVITSLSLAV